MVASGVSSIDRSAPLIGQLQGPGPRLKPTWFQILEMFRHLIPCLQSLFLHRTWLIHVPSPPLPALQQPTPFSTHPVRTIPCQQEYSFHIKAESWCRTLLNLSLCFSDFYEFIFTCSQIRTFSLMDDVGWFHHKPSVLRKPQILNWVTHLLLDILRS